MRTFDDPGGRRWQAALLEASYGSFTLCFSPLAGCETHCAPWAADNLGQAAALLAALDDAALCALLAEAARPEQAGAMAGGNPS
ncbi:MAG: hypothetical protein IT502_01820 [Rubrivivax sp.]|nr:hypothetical protein [Rubrivivax sp.]